MAIALRYLLLLALITLLLHCETAPASALDTDALPAELGPNAALIRNPVDQDDDAVDTTNVARIRFAEDLEFRFNEVKEGSIVTHDFKFTNDGTVPLLITNARSTCGCTVPSYPETPVAPGDSGVISVAFDTKNKSGRQRKPVTITANTYPASTVIYMDGTVIKE
jgi:hypothetical protein